MEEEIALLIADLSGYTALTETHGASVAADLIDKYSEIVRTCLVGDSQLHERVGDEVMIVSTSADSLLSTATMILKNTSTEDYFLQVHGGLHYGKILKRNNSYFGTTVNLTSRIAAKASPGTFWGSEVFVKALAGKSAFALQSKDKHSFKNISEEMELFELAVANPIAFYIDPICRMLINNCEKALPHPTKKNVFFCSSHCLELYFKNQPVDSTV